MPALRMMKANPDPAVCSARRSSPYEPARSPPRFPAPAPWKAGVHGGHTKRWGRASQATLVMSGRAPPPDLIALSRV